MRIVRNGNIAKNPKLFKMGQFKIISINFSRISNGLKMLHIMEKFSHLNIDIFCIQEIDIQSAIKYMNDKFQVIEKGHYNL